MTSQSHCLKVECFQPLCSRRSSSKLNLLSTACVSVLHAVAGPGFDLTGRYFVNEEGDRKSLNVLSVDGFSMRYCIFNLFWLNYFKELI